MRSRKPASRPGLCRADAVAAALLLLLSTGIAAPAVYQANAKQERNTSVNNLKQLGLAVHNIHDAYKQFPPIAGTLGPKDASLHYHLLPYLEQANLYNLGDLAAALEIMRAPADRSAPAGGVYKRVYGTTNYAGNWLVFKGGPRAPGKTTLPQLTNMNGTSNTMMFTERYQVCNGTPCAWGYSQFYYWTPMFGYFSRGKFQVHPPQETCDPALPQSLLREGILIGMCDGSVRFAGNNLGAEVWGRALDPANATPFELPDEG
jgi:hypothetical protein